VRAALAALGDRYTFVAALFLGGGEKLRAGDAEDYGVPVRAAAAPPGTPDARGAGEAPGGALGAQLAALLAETGAAVVVDLSDEPVLGYRERFALISVALAGGARYEGADFDFRPQTFTRLASKPALAVIGTGKRVGKTAVSGFAARRLAQVYGPDGVLVVAMGRGGPPQPEVVHGGAGLTAAELLAASRAGHHAASDCYEDAALAGVTTIGCRRCGGGMAGGAFDSNIADALPLVEQSAAALAIFEGSGAVIPPVAAQGRLCVSAANQPVDYVAGYLGAYRLLLSDLLVLTMCEPPFADPLRVAELRAAAQAVKPSLEVVETVFRPRPAEPIRGRRVAYFTTAAPEALAPLVHHLEQECGAEVVIASGDLASRPALAAAVARAEAAADVFLTEIKAAAIDVVAEAADRTGKQLVFCDNEPVACEGSDLGTRIVALAAYCGERFARGE
jgi:cyclic 2,3-diphosphoglycerate synthetase